MYSFTNKIQDIVFSSFGIKLDNVDSLISTPPKKELGDYTLNCFSLAKQLSTNPNELTISLAELFNKESDFFSNTTSAGGYVNFFLNDKLFVQDLFNIDLNQKSEKNETIVVDYIGANVGKPLHIGHLCTPSLGQSIINIYKHLGFNVISDSHFGDWGGIFGKLIFMWKYFQYLDYKKSNVWKFQENEFNNEDKDTYFELIEVIKKDHSKIKDKENVNKLLELILEELDNIINNKPNFIIYYFYLYQYITIFSEINENLDSKCREEFKKLSQGNLINVEIWKKITGRSIFAANSQLKDELNIEPQYNIGESFYEGLNLPRPNDENYPELQYNMKEIVKILLDNGVASQNEDGSVGVIFPDETKLPSCVLQKKDGTGLYLTSDLAAIKYRLDNWKPAKIIYFVDVRQQLHLKQAFYIAKKAWKEAENTELFHAFNGFIKLKEGAMSTRKGTVIFLKDLIEEGYKRTQEILTSKGRELSQDNIKAITIAAIKYSYLSQDREKDVVFDWDKALNFEGNSGPYIQYAYVRASKIITNYEPCKNVIANLFQDLDSEINSEGQISLTAFDKSLIKKLLEFEGKIEETAKKYKPSIVAQYCYELAQEFNSFYVNSGKILDEKDENVKNLKLYLVSMTAAILKKGFELLAIDMPSEM